MIGDHYEVKVCGEWVPVPSDKINNVVAPDDGAHVCAPEQIGHHKGVLFCVILPPEGWVSACTGLSRNEAIRLQEL